MIAHGRLAKRVSSMKCDLKSSGGLAWVCLLLVMLLTTPAVAQKLQMPGSADENGTTKTADEITSVNDTPFSVESSGDVATPASYSTSGMYYNPTLGSHVRARYNTQSYGQEKGNLDLGTMKVWDRGNNTVTFFDGQITLNEESHVGYNLGLGYRWMDLPLFPFSPDNQKIYGVSLWTDGQGAGGDSFFPQIGLGFEILGDRTDFRTNVHIPLGPESKDRDFVSGGETIYTGNFLAEELIGIRDTSLTVVDGELAGRISNLEAWLFGGVYGYSGGEYDEVGGKIGLRGYATPDLALQIALTNDNVFDTNAVFSATWFIGRTRRENRPTGALRDRFREPVIRNDYVALASKSVSAASDALLDVNGDPIRIVHIDSTAAAGGDGTFENPFSTLADAGGSGSMEGDILLAHAGSTFAADSVTLQDNQRLLGEGIFDNNNGFVANTNIDHTVTVQGGSSFSLPETATGAFTMDAPTITNAAGETAVMLADNNEVNNLVISGGDRAIQGNVFAPNADPTLDMNGSGDSNLMNLHIDSTTGNAIELTMARREDPNDASQSTLEMDVNLENIFLEDIAGTYGILINADDAGFGSNPVVAAINESTTINNVSVTNPNNSGTAIALGIQNTTSTTATTTITDFVYDGGTSGLGGMQFNAVDGTVTVNGTTTFTGGDIATAGPGIDIMNSPGTFTFADTVAITNVAGTAINVDGDSPNVTYNGSLENSDGNAVTVQNLTGGLAQFTFNNGLNDTGTGIDVNNLTGGTVRFLTSDSANRNSINSGTETAITVINVTDATAMVTFEDFDVTTNNTDAIVADATNTDGTLVMNDTTVAVGGTGRGVVLDQTSGTNFQSLFNGLQVTTESGTAIFAEDANLTVAAGTNTTPNTITTTVGGTALALTDVSVNAGVAFDEVNVSGGAANAIALDNVGDGPVTIGSNTGTDGAGGTLTTTGIAVEIQDVDDFTIGDVTIAGSGITAIEVTNTDATARGATFNNIHTPTGIETALDVDQNSTGAQSITVTDSEFNGTVNAAEAAVEIDNTTGTVLISGTTIDNGAGEGIALTGTGGTVTIDSGTTISNQASTALAIDGGDGQVNFDGTINNSAAKSVSILNKTGGGVSFSPTASITDTGTGVEVNMNSGGTYNLLGNFDLETAGVDAVTVTNNTGANITFGTLDIETTTGRGFVASGGGTIGVNAGSSITTTTGTAVDMNGVTLANTGVTFDSINTNGATNGVVLNNIDGAGSFTVNGGTITSSTASAITATNVTRLRVNDVTVDGAGTDAITLDNNDTNFMDVRIDNFTVTGIIAGEAINSTHTGSGAFDLGITNSSNIGAEASVVASGGGELDVFVSNTNFTTGKDVTGFDLSIGGSLTSADVSFDNVDIDTNDGVGFAFNSSGTANVKSVRFAMLNGSVVNNSNTASTRAFDGNIGGSTTLDATIESNNFNNAGTGDTFLLSSTAVGVNLDLNLNDNSTTSGSITLDKTNGTFRVIDRDNANSNNNSNVIFLPGIGDFDSINIGDVNLPND